MKKKDKERRSGRDQRREVGKGRHLVLHNEKNNNEEKENESGRSKKKKGSQNTRIFKKGSERKEIYMKMWNKVDKRRTWGEKQSTSKTENRSQRCRGEEKRGKVEINLCSI